MQFVCPLLLLSGPVGLWWGWIPKEHHCVLLYLSFFPLVSFSVRLLGNTSAWEGPIHLPFSLMGLFLLHVSQLSEERVWTAAQLLPKLNGFFMSAAPHKLPRTTAPRCGYSRGLHAPNSGCNSSLKMFLFYFFFSCLESRLSGYWWVRNKCKAFLLYWRTSDFFFFGLFVSRKSLFYARLMKWIKSLLVPFSQMAFSGFRGRKQTQRLADDIKPGQASNTCQDRGIIPRHLVGTEAWQEAEWDAAWKTCKLMFEVEIKWKRTIQGVGKTWAAVTEKHILMREGRELGTNEWYCSKKLSRITIPQEAQGPFSSHAQCGCHRGTWGQAMCGGHQGQYLVRLLHWPMVTHLTAPPWATAFLLPSLSHLWQIILCKRACKCPTSSHALELFFCVCV